MRTSSYFKNAGLEDLEARTFVGEVQVPLTREEQIALTSLFQMLWSSPQPESLAEDWAEYKRLCTPGSPDFILDIPDYYGFFTYSMFHGKVTK
jgi:hypothetical protein